MNALIKVLFPWIGSGIINPSVFMGTETTVHVRQDHSSEVGLFLPRSERNTR